MSLREKITKRIRALGKDLDKYFPNPGILSKDQQTDGEFVIVTEEIEDHLNEAAAYADIPDLELIDNVERAAQYMEKRALLFRQSADGWEISYKDEKKFFLKDTKGLNCLAHLLAKQHQSISVLALGATEEKHLPPDTPYSKMSEDELESQGLHLGDKGDDILDAEAKKDYMNRIKELDEEMASAALQEDDENEDVLQTEKDEILHQLQKGTGLGGKPRKFSGDTERARSNLTNHIKRAVEKIRQQNPELAKHLDDTIETRNHCVYRPGGDMRWKMS